MHSLHLSLFEYADFIRNTDVSKIEIIPKEVRVTSKQSGMQFAFDRRDFRSQPLELFNFDFYEQAEINIILKMLPRKAVLYDVGAHIGWYSLLIAKSFLEATIYAFEPVRSTFEYLKKNVELNNIKNIRVYNLGFSDKAGSITFYVNPSAPGNASYVNLNPSGEIEKVTCRIERIDDFVGKHKKKISCIKCDVEGAEFFVLKGAEETLKTQKPIIFTEMLRKWADKFNYHPNQMIQFLSKLGYQCYTIHGKKLRRFLTMTEKTVSTNFFFLHSDRHQKLIHLLTSS